MALYFYRALSKQGKKISGYIDASSPTHAKEQLSHQGLYPIDIISAQQREASGWWRSLFSKKLSTKDRILFTKQLAVLLKAGIPLLQALELLVEQFTGATRSMLIAIKDEVKQGTSLAQALKEYPKNFDQIYVQLVRAGEASGKLELVLDRLAIYLERKEETRKRIKGALMQPAIQLSIAVLVTAGLLIWVVPSMVETLTDMDVQLPLVTRIATALSYGVAHYSWLILMVVLVPTVFVLYWRSTPKGAYTIDVIKLKIPILGYFVRMNAVVQFCNTFGMLLQAGVNLAEALDIVVNIIDNRVLTETLKEARDKIIKQGKIAQYLKQTGLFPPIAIYLINTGEQTGQLDQMLLTIGANYQEELTEWTDALTAALNPILLIGMAIIVGFIILAVVTPMLEMGQNLTT